MLRLAREGKPIRVVEDHVASPTYAPALASRSIDLLERDFDGIFHIGGGRIGARAPGPTLCLHDWLGTGEDLRGALQSVRGEQWLPCQLRAQPAARIGADGGQVTRACP